jgi:predicted O-methyltransferase YrrM
MNTFDYIIKKYHLNLTEKRIDGYMIIPRMRRTDLANLFNELGFKAGAEIGVLGGKYSEVLCRVMPNAKIYSIDSWRTYSEFPDFFEKDKLKNYYNYAVRILSKFKNNKIIKKNSMNALKDFKDESLDFVYIDANHTFKYVYEDVEKWTKKVRKGGIVAGHDFEEHIGKKAFGDVKPALDVYIRHTDLDCIFIVGKRMSKNRDYNLSWFFVKQ